MLTALYLHRRRLILTFVALMGSSVLHHGWTYLSYSPDFVLFSALIFALLGVGFAVFVVILAPALRCAVECVALAFLAVRIVEFTPLEGPSGDILDTSYGFLSFALLYMVVYQLLYGKWWRRTRVRLRHTIVSRFATGVAPDVIWSRLVPDATRPGDHYSGTLSELAPIEGRPGALVCRTRVGPSTVMEETWTNIVSEPPRDFSYDFATITSLHGAPPITGRWTLRIAPEGERSRVEVREALSAASPDIVTLAWIDDLAGQIAVAMRAALEERNDPTVLTRLRRAAGAVA